MEVLDHFFRQRPVDSNNDDGDDSKTLDCWELKVGVQASSFDNVVKALEEEIIEKKWQTKKDEALKAKPLAKKLRNVVSALDITATMAKAKISRL